jgi:hypothetical protein
MLTNTAVFVSVLIYASLFLNQYGLLRPGPLAVSFRAVLLERAYSTPAIAATSEMPQQHAIAPILDAAAEIRMKTSALLLRVLACSVLLFAFGFSIIRAGTQAISHDEALTYLWFLDGGVDKLLHFNVNHREKKSIQASAVFIAALP